MSAAHAWLRNGSSQKVIEPVFGHLMFARPAAPAIATFDTGVQRFVPPLRGRGSWFVSREAGTSAVTVKGQ